MIIAKSLRAIILLLSTSTIALAAENHDVLSLQGQRYIDYTKKSGNWGGYVEAHGIASYRGFRTNIIGTDGNVITEIGREQDPADHKFSLLWNGFHYQVIDPQNGNEIVHDPASDGNCLYEALYFIARTERNGVDNHLISEQLANGKRRRMAVGSMRRIAAHHLADNPWQANISGEEMEDFQRKSHKPLDKSSQEVLFFLYSEGINPKNFLLVKEKNNFSFKKRKQSLSDDKKLSLILKNNILGKNPSERNKTLTKLANLNIFLESEKAIKGDLSDAFEDIVIEDTYNVNVVDDQSKNKGGIDTFIRKYNGNIDEMYNAQGQLKKIFEDNAPKDSIDAIALTVAVVNKSTVYYSLRTNHKQKESIEDKREKKKLKKAGRQDEIVSSKSQEHAEYLSTDQVLQSVAEREDPIESVHLLIYTVTAKNFNDFAPCVSCQTTVPDTVKSFIKKAGLKNENLVVRSNGFEKHHLTEK